MVAYLDDFKAIMLLTVAMIPMVLLLSSPRQRVKETAPAAAVLD